MRKVLFLLFLIPYLHSHAQDTSKVEQYCELVANERLFSNKVTIDINYGEERSIWRDYRVKNDIGKLQKFNSTVDALNYLGKDGWKLVNAYPITIGNQTVYHFFFKKEFDKSQTAQR